MTDAPDANPPETRPRALISVSDKTGIVELAQALSGAGYDLLSTGGTARALREAGLAVRDVSDVTQFREMMDGRVKTLHPAIHGGILARRDDAQHMADAEAAGVGMIDVVAVNLYPFSQTVAAGADDPVVLENIDIGGPALIRAAAKNHQSVLVVVDPADYSELVEALGAQGAAAGTSEAETSEAGTSQAGTSQAGTSQAGDAAPLSPGRRAELARKAFAHTAAYDAAVAEWFCGYVARGADAAPTAALAGVGGPAGAGVPSRGGGGGAGGVGLRPLRYGENPHQTARLVVTQPQVPGAATAKQLQGKALSYNNLNDTDAAFELISEFDPEAAAAVAIIKHANPCGVAVHADQAEALTAARACDPVSAFGGIIAFNGPLTADAARVLIESFTEVVIAPGFDDEAREVLAAKKDMRVLETGALLDPARAGEVTRTIAGGSLVQSRDAARVTADDLNVVTRRAPDAREIADLLFAFTVAKHVKSNAIVYAKDGCTTGIGAGQMSRLDSARIAVRKGEDAARMIAEAKGVSGDGAAIENLVRGSVVASDAFFPFADGLIAAAEAGVTAVIQPGGSVRDAEVIAAADDRGLAMVFTGVRHFRH